MLVSRSRVSIGSTRFAVDPTRRRVANTRLIGEIPPELGNLVNLDALDLINNQLSGEIPPELGDLANLEYLHLGGNQLSGCVPSSLSGRLGADDTDLVGFPFCP